MMADKLREVAQRDDMELTEGTLAFLEAHEPEVKQAMLRCGDGGAKSAIPRAAVPCKPGVSGPTQPAVGGNVSAPCDRDARRHSTSGPLGGAFFGRLGSPRGPPK